MKNLLKVPYVLLCFLAANFLAACQDRELALYEVIEEFEQKTQQKIDVLYVVDSSGTMRDNIDNVLSGSASFVDALASSNADYRIGMIAMNVKDGEGNFPGELLAAPGSTKIIQSTDGRDTVIANFNSNLDYMLGIGTSKGCEAGLEAVKLAIDPLLNLNPGFTRSDADLAIIFVTDEDDASTNPQPDDVCTDASTGDFISKYPKLFETVDQYLGFYKTVKGQRYFLHGILTLSKSDCPESAEESSRFREAIDATSGFAASICLSDYSSFLDDLGLKIAQLATSFTLKLPVNLSTLKITINGVELNSSQYTYDSTIHAIFLDSTKVSIAAGDKLVFRYFADPTAERLQN